MSENDTRPISGLCECRDPNCSCDGQCVKEGIVILYRTDREDNIGVKFCFTCVDHAHDSGLYRDYSEPDFDEWLSDIFDDDDYAYLSDDDLPF